MIPVFLDTPAAPASLAEPDFWTKRGTALLLALAT
jgi:hypothetical protein